MNVRTKNLICACRRLEETTSPAQKWRPQFHLSPPTGWMNDPNGLCQFRGSHHIFFQYSPFDVQTGLNYWGHFETADFVHYQYHEPALCSDEQFDCHGVYSGSALENDGVLYLFYTGNVKKTGDGYDYVNNGREHNTIRACSRDGVNFGEKTLLLSNSDYPGNVTCHVRDPKVWKDAAGGHMVLGARRRDDVGEVLVYRSGDLLHWTLASTITTPEPFGFMWECPDFFRLDGAQVLSFSPQGVEAQDWKYENIYQSGYCLLDGALEGDYTLSEFQEYDHGFDFYAPQTYEDESGRRILIGWMGMPDSDYAYPEKEYQWTQMLTIPRELHVRNGRVYQQPVAELRTLRRTAAHQTVAGTAAFPAAPAWELEVQCSGAAPLEIRFGGDARFRWADGMCRLELGKSGCGRTLRRMPLETLEQVQIFRDASSMEIFLNGGEAVFSTRFYPADDRLEITAAQAEATRWTLAAMEIRKDGES